MNYKVGDIVECLPGFKDHWDRSLGNAVRDMEYGGAGYRPNKIFEIRQITFCPIRGQVLFPWEHTGGLFANAVRLKKENFLIKKLTKTFDFVENNK